MDRISNLTAYTKNRRKQVGSGTEIRQLAKILNRMAFFLKRIIGSRSSLNRNFNRLQFKRLFHLGGKHNSSAHNNCRANIQLSNFIVICNLLSLKDDLHSLKATSVIKIDKSECLAVTNTSRPTADGDLFAVKCRLIGIYTFDQFSFHHKPHLAELIFRFF